MPFCRYCGKENSSRAKVCSECGRRLPVRRRNRFQRLTGIIAAYFREKPIRLFIPAALVALLLLIVFTLPKEAKEVPGEASVPSATVPRETAEPIRLSTTQLVITIDDFGELRAENTSSPVRFECSDEEVAIISQDGAVKGLKLGNAVISSE